MPFMGQRRGTGSQTGEEEEEEKEEISRKAGRRRGGMGEHCIKKDPWHGA